jgi:hypothetical protein
MFALVFITLLVSGAVGLTYMVQAFPLRLTDKDRAEIIRLTLERALVDKEITGYYLIEHYETIILSTENINPNLVPTISGVNLTLLEAEGIQEKADSEGDFLFLHFEQMQIKDFRVIVLLYNTFAVGKDSNRAYLCGGGFAIRYHRGLFGGWVSEPLCIWES